ncbi:hypothetical protein H0H87_012992 [Tephrocybe sp. NHM501043]|nr:hypothetical protein H0H87_012992 [Tephrocybe sp. NHM501043]
MTPSSAFELSSSQYATRRKEMLALLKQLRATGSQAELDLPRITVIGNQSAGKSSVVEAISGITVPRDAGTCTRCPMECRLSKTARRWTCQISIRREYDESGNVLDKVSETPFGDVITDKKDVELALRRAQVAVLNPHVPPSEILRASAKDLTGPHFASSRSHKFSRDTVCIDLEGPELTDLSFVDLPGLIQNADPQIIKLVEDMVVSHIKGNCLILVALPMTDDIENQKALRLARQEDTDGRRTIGVMTKPDMLTAGQTKSREIWLDIIEGRRHPLVHGYYCTRQPDDAQRAAEITQEEARAAESAFFSAEIPWSTSSRKNRFGTVHLIASLSDLLIGIINETIPRIRTEAANKLNACNHELTALPKAIDEDPANYMLKLLTRFCDGVHHSVHSGSDDIQLVHLNKTVFAEFKATIRRTAPNFVPVKEGLAGAATKVDELAMGQPFYLDNMRKHIERSITRELPNNTPFSAKEDLIVEFQAGWESAIEVCFAAIRKHVENMLNKHVENHFHRYDHLEGHVRIFIADIVEKHSEACKAILQPVLKIETTPFTQNGHYLSESVDKWLALYKEARAKEGRPPLKKRKSHDEATPAPKKASNLAPKPSETSTNGASFPPHEPSSSGVRAFQQGSGAFSFAPQPGNSAFGANLSHTTVFNGFGNGNNAFGAGPQTTGISAFGANSSWTSNFNGFTNGNNAFGAPQGEPVQAAFPFRMPVVTQPPTPVSQPSTPAPQPSASAEEIGDPERQKRINEVLAGLAALGYHGVTESDLPKMIPPDEYEREIQVMAEVRGYFQIAYKRIIDNIPSLIDLLFVKAIASDMQGSLISKLSLGTADAKERCAMYLAENPTVLMKRKELTVRKERLEEVRHALHAFGLST